MRIAVYSGSFDPLHIGHEAIMRRLMEDGRFGCVYLVLSPQSPFKPEGKAFNAQARLEAAREAVASHPELSARVDDIEMTMPAPHYTVRTLDALREREPDNSFTLVIGADNLAVFRGWRDYARILRDYGVVVFPREGTDAAAVRESLLAEDPSYRIELVDAPLVNISSTAIREGLEKGEDMSDFLM